MSALTTGSKLDRQTSLARARLGYETLEAKILDGHYDQSGVRTFGTEVEGCFFSRDGYVMGIIEDVLRLAEAAGGIDGLTRELMIFNFELNGNVSPLSGNPFGDFIQMMTRRIDQLAQVASQLGAQVGFIGIAPSLTDKELVPANYSLNPRYLELRAALQELYSNAVYNILGPQAKLAFGGHLDTEGANASVQFHLSVKSKEIVNFGNAAMLAAQLVVAASGSSPLLLGRRLWEETRIPVFEQSTRGRAHFRKRWISDPLAVFAESLKWDPIIREDVDPLTAFSQLHGTNWDWIRFVPFPGAITIEFRPVGSGPTMIDVAANAALFVGLTLHFQERIGGLINQGLNFEPVREGFYAAARYGLDAQLTAVTSEGRSGEAIPADQAVLRLLPAASQALTDHGVDLADANRMIGVIEDRVRSRLTAAHWLTQAVPLLGAPAAVAQYLHHSQNGLGAPVSQWPLAT